MLSLTYTLLTQELGSLCEAEGLEVAIGFLHQIDRGRPSLALDLVEAFRQPVGDRFVFELLRKALFGPKDFRPAPDGAIWLTPDGLRRFLAYYERWMLAPRPASGGPFRERLRREVRKLLAALRNKTEFEPWRTAGEEEECELSSATI